jgi:hypothetical protein
VSTVTLPNWPPARLVRESALAWNLRHPNRKGLDPATSDWPTLCNCVLGFLRHQHSKFDSRLKARQAFHQEYRDELADEILRCARAKYPWLRPEHDPRPFLENGDSTKLVLDARGFQARTDAQYDRSPEFRQSAISAAIHPRNPTSRRSKLLWPVCGTMPSTNSVP